MKISVLVLSDRCHRKEAEDKSGPALTAWLEIKGHADVPVTILPDEQDAIKKALLDRSEEGLDLVLTCGGTGVSPRDVTPEATLAVIERELPGFGEAMRAESRRFSPHAAISRATAGLRGGMLIVNLPGSPKAAIENLAAVWPAIPHCIDKAQGDQSPCG